MQYDDFLVKLEQGLSDLLVENTSETKQRIGLPNSYFVASNERVAGFNMPHMYYWDSYFICQGLKRGKYQDYDIGIAENCFSLIERLGFVPNSNSFQNLSRSQPPLLAKLVQELVEDKRVDEVWQRRAYLNLKEEYENVWMNVNQPHIRKVHDVLSRYYDSNALHSLAEAESGWDYTNRFDDRALDFLPIDLNSFLHTYEEVLAKLADRFEKDLVEKFTLAKETRKNTINALLWHEQAGLYFDYDFKKSQLSSVKSLAAYAALFSGLASAEQAQRMVENLKFFETEHGLSCTELNRELEVNKQWTSPNGWAPLHFIVVEGLDRYGHQDEAKRIAGKWIELVKNDYEKRNQFEEKYNVLNPNDKPLRGLYPDQVGFGWTNSVTKYFIEKYFSKTE